MLIVFFCEGEKGGLLLLLRPDSREVSFASRTTYSNIVLPTLYCIVYLPPLINKGVYSKIRQTFTL